MWVGSPWESMPCKFSSGGGSRVWRWSWLPAGRTARWRSPATRPDRSRPRRSTSIRFELAAFTDKGEAVGKNGVYIAGDTPASTKFVTGRFMLLPGKSPHAPHTHAEEEVMIIESGHGEIFCDGKTTKIGPGSVMYTTPNAPHGITNTGSEPIVFYYVKWESRK